MKSRSPLCALLLAVGCGPATSTTTREHAPAAASTAPVVDAPPPTPAAVVAPTTSEGPRRVAASDEHACAVEKGRVACWGSNRHGQLGDGTTKRKRKPVAVPGIDDAVDVAAGKDATCVLHASGKISCFGRSGFGAVCAGGGTCPSPTEIIGVAGAVGVAVGHRHACAVTKAGSVACWGNNDHGQLSGTGANLSAPRLVGGVRDAVAVTAGGRSSCALVQSGEVFCWGDGERGRLGDGATASKIEGPRAVAGVRDVTAIASEGPRTCARRKDGTVLCWGGLQEHNQPEGEQTAVAPLPFADAETVAVGAGEACVIRATGRVSCVTAKAPPLDVKGLAKATAISVGRRFGCAVGDGKLACWGRNDDGTLGHGDATWFGEPVEVPGIDDATQVIAVEYGTCALRKSGRVACWGGTPKPDTHTPLDVEKVADATRLFAGFDKVCAARTSGNPACFPAQRRSAAPVSGFEIATAGEQVAPRGIPALALDHGKLFYFDRSGRGRLRSPVSGLSGVVAVDAYYNSACAVRRDADVVCWEWDQSAFEAGVEKGSTFAVKLRAIPGTRGATAVAMAPQPCALMATGKVVCFDALKKEPLRAKPDVDDAIAIAAGPHGHCALHRSGEVSCWGQIGGGSDAAFRADGKIAGIKDAVSVSMASYHTCVTTQSGRVKCWGSNLGGRLGQPDIEEAEAPVEVSFPGP